MNKCVKIWLISAATLMVIGAVLFVIVLASVSFDFRRLGTQNYKMKTYEVSESFENIAIDIQTADITFASSNDDKCRVEHLNEDRIKCLAIVDNNTLKITTVDTGKWYDYIGVYIGSTKLTVYLPKDIYTSLSIRTQTGEIDIPNQYSFESISITGTTSDINCYASVSKKVEIRTSTGEICLDSGETDTIQLSATTGDIILSDVICNSLTANSSTGEIRLKNVISKGSITAENTTGGIIFKGCDAPDITVITSTGSVKGTLLSEKIFVTDTSTGEISVPNTISGGKCKITTSTGDIEIDIE